MRAFEAPGVSRSAHPSAPRRAEGRRWTRPSHQQRAKLARALLLCALVVLVVAAAALTGLCMMTAPAPPEAAISSHADYRMGRAVYRLPGGTMCRQALFDNRTGAMSAGAFV